MFCRSSSDHRQEVLYQQIIYLCSFDTECGNIDTARVDWCTACLHSAPHYEGVWGMEEQLHLLHIIAL